MNTILSSKEGSPPKKCKSQTCILSWKMSVSQYFSVSSQKSVFRDHSCCSWRREHDMRIPETTTRTIGGTNLIGILYWFRCSTVVSIASTASSHSRQLGLTFSVARIVATVYKQSSKALGVFLLFQSLNNQQYNGFYINLSQAIS